MFFYKLVFVLFLTFASIADEQILEEQLRVAATGNEFGRQETVQEHDEGEKCLVVGDPIVRNVGTGQNNMMVECFPGIRTKQLHRVLDNRDLGNPDTVVIHV
jgi:hypothetical protein